MLTRAWTGRVAPDWNVRVTGADEAPSERTIDPSWAEADDSTLVHLCLAGQRNAFDVIVERHRRQVYQLCYRYVGNHEDASDLAQDAFVRAFKGLKGFKGESSLATWLYRITVNACLNRLALKTPRSEPLEPGDRDRFTRRSAGDSAPQKRARGGSPRRNQTTSTEAACDVDSSDLS